MRLKRKHKFSLGKTNDVEKPDRLVSGSIRGRSESIKIRQPEISRPRLRSKYSTYYLFTGSLHHYQSTYLEIYSDYEQEDIPSLYTPLPA